MLQIDLTMSDRELSLFVAVRCAELGTVKSVQIHRQPKPFALVDMATHAESQSLAAQYGRPAFGTCVLFHLEQAQKPS